MEKAAKVSIRMSYLSALIRSLEAFRRIEIEVLEALEAFDPVAEKNADEWLDFLGETSDSIDKKAWTVVEASLKSEPGRNELMEIMAVSDREMATMSREDIVNFLVFKELVCSKDRIEQTGITQATREVDSYLKLLFRSH